MLAGLALLSGLGLCVHSFALLPLPVYVAVAVRLVVRRKLPAWSLAAAGGAYLLGAAAYIAMTVHLAVVSGDAGGAIHSALFGNYAPQVLNASSISRHMKANAALAGLNLVSFMLPLAVIGWLRMRSRLGAPDRKSVV